MNWRRILIIAAIIAAGIGVYTLYLYIGPYRHLARENRRLKQEIAATDTTESKMEAEIEGLKETLANKTSLAEELGAEIDGLRQQISTMKGGKELSEELERLQGEYDQKTQDLQKQIAYRQQEFQNLEAEAEKLRSTVATLEVDKKAVGDDVSKLNKQLEQAKRRIHNLSEEAANRDKDLEKAKKAHETMVKQLQEQLQEKARQISGLETETEQVKVGYQQRIKGLEEELAQREQQVQEVQTQGEELHQTIQTLEAERNTLTQEASELKGQLDEFSMRFQTLSQQMASQEEELKSLRQTHQTLLTHLGEVLAEANEQLKGQPKPEISEGSPVETQSGTN
jgi:chromosome segregation ATPase